MTKGQNPMENEEEIIVDDTEETENQEQELQTPEVDAEKEELKKKLKTVEAQKDHWRKKATESKEAKTETSSNLSPKDLYALMQAGVSEDDIDEVTEFAGFKKISVAEALKHDVVKTILSNKKEFRKTAEVTNATPSRKGVAKVTDDVLTANLSKGIIPENADEAERLFWARNGGKR